MAPGSATFAGNDNHLRKASPVTAKQRTSPSNRTLPDQIAIGIRSGKSDAIRERLAEFGRIEGKTSGNIFILHLGSKKVQAAAKSAVEALRREKLATFAAPVVEDRATGARMIVTDEIVVRLKPGCAPKETLATLETEHGVTVRSRNEFEPEQYVVKVGPAAGTNTIEIARAIDARDDVEFASPNYLTAVKRSS